MARPERRRSSLAAASPIGADSPPPAMPVKSMADEADRSQNGRSGSRSTASAGTMGVTAPVTSAPKRDKNSTTSKTRIGPYVSDDEANRVRAAYLHGWTRENQGSFTDFLKSAIMRTVEDLENTHNGGEPWPTVGGNAVKSVAQMNVEAVKRQHR